MGRSPRRILLRQVIALILRSTNTNSRPQTTPTLAPLTPDSAKTSYVSALYALYNDQHIAGLSPRPHPHVKALKAVLERLKID